MSQKKWFLNFWFWEKKGSQIFLGHWSAKKLQIFNKYWKNTIQESSTKKVQFCNRYRNSHFFFDSSCILENLLTSYIILCKLSTSTWGGGVASPTTHQLEGVLPPILRILFLHWECLKKKIFSIRYRTAPPPSLNYLSIFN